MHARRSWGRLLAVGCLVASACAPVPPPTRIELPERKFTVADVKLPSGLQVLVENDPTTRVVASALVVSAGGADDPPGQEGLAHLVEHLTFRAHRPGKPSLATWLALHGIGGWNGITEMDLTSYYLVGPPDTLSAMVDAEVARMEAPLEGVDEEIFRAERGVVLAELHTRDESGRRAELGRALLSQLFSPTHPYARWVGGTPESVGKITLAQAQAWAELHYQPRRMTWVLAGALDRAETAALLEQRVPARLRDAAPSPPAASRRPSPGARPAPARAGNASHRPRAGDPAHPPGRLEAATGAGPDGAHHRHAPGDGPGERIRRRRDRRPNRPRVHGRRDGAQARARAAAGCQPRGGLEEREEGMRRCVGRRVTGSALAHRV